MTSTALPRPDVAPAMVSVTGPRPAPGQAPGRGAHPGAVLALVAAGALAVMLLWWHDAPSISGFGD
ncbi:MAG: hypothetical protein ACJ74O_01975 [Frankiaceae bacterium]